MAEYRKVLQESSKATPLWMIVVVGDGCEEIVCEGMYGWAADWLLEVLGDQPYAPNRRSPSAPVPQPKKGELDG